METADCLAYNFVSLNQGAMTVEFKGPSNCHIGLMSVRGEDRPLTEIILGGWNNQASVIRVNRESPDRVRVDTPNLLNAQFYSKFHIQWQNGTLWVRRNDAQGPVVIEGKDCVNFIVNHVAFRSGWGASGQWRVQLGDQSMTRMTQQGSAMVDLTKPQSRPQKPALESRIGNAFAQRGTPSPPPCTYIGHCGCALSDSRLLLFLPLLRSTISQ